MTVAANADAAVDARTRTKIRREIRRLILIFILQNCALLNAASSICPWHCKVFVPMLVGKKFMTRCQLHKTGMTYFFGEEDVHIFIAELSNQTWCAATAPAAGQFATDLVSNDMTCSCSFCRLGLVCASRPSPSWAERRKNIARRRTPSLPPRKKDILSRPSPPLRRPINARFRSIRTRWRAA